MASHKKFFEELDLPFPLLADEGGKVSKLYGIALETPKGEVLSGRSAFLLDRDGSLEFADAKYALKPEDHDALMKAVESEGSRTVVSGHGPDGGKEPRPGFAPPRIEGIEFGSITVNGKKYDTDVVLDRGKVRERKKGPSKGEKEKYGHTPLTPKEEIPWDCKTLVLGIGMDGKLPVVDELKGEAKRRGVELILLKTPEAVKYLLEHYGEGMNAILHVTC